MSSAELKSAALSVLINAFIFSSLPVLHGMRKPASRTEPIQIDLVKVRKKKIIQKKAPPREEKKLVKKERLIKPELRKRISFEISPDALSAEVDLIAPFVTYDLDEVDRLPRLAEYVKPDYPEEARAKGAEGVVVLKILIDREGKVTTVKVTDNGGFYEFARAASQAVRRWRYEPAKIMNMPVAVWCIQEVRFVIE